MLARLTASVRAERLLPYKIVRTYLIPVGPRRPGSSTIRVSRSSAGVTLADRPGATRREASVRGSRPIWGSHSAYGRSQRRRAGAAALRMRPLWRAFAPRPHRRRTMSSPTTSSRAGSLAAPGAMGSFDRPSPSSAMRWKASRSDGDRPPHSRSSPTSPETRGRISTLRRSARREPAAS